MSNPDDRRYSQTHQWAKPDADGLLDVGITDFAQSQLGDVVFVQLPETGRTVARDEACALVESVKSASDVHAPVSGVIIAINDALPNHVDSVNTSPYDAWFFKMKPDSADAVNSLMTAEEYRQFTA
jgi:glycine cleavage system H protein